MKFGEKYELLESLTTGAVETFAANDKVRGERVVVHILHCAARQPNQASSDWICTSFRQIAPEPAGPVLETGRFSDQYAYLVIKPTDEAALKSWVRRYEVHGKEAEEATPDKAVLAEEDNPAQIASAPSSPPDGKVTQLLREFDLHATPQPAVPIREVHRPRPPAYSETRDEPVFLPPTRAEFIVVNSDELQASNVPAPVPAPETAPENRPNTKSHEFTSFFQSPFHPDGRPETPEIALQASPPAQKTVGEFTAMFDPAASAEPPLSAPDAGTSAQPSFTDVFLRVEGSPLTVHSSTPLPSESVLSTSVEPPPAPEKQSSESSQSYAAPSIPSGMSSPPPIVPLHSAGGQSPVRSTAVPADGATSAFSGLGSEPVAVEPAVPAGPSPYTQIIDKKNLEAMQEAEISEAENSSKSAPSKLSASALPKVPAAPAPFVAPPPKPTLPPRPPAPKLTVPPAPKPWKAEASPSPVSYWPLILTLTVLFFLAILLVLYFVLKPQGKADVLFQFDWGSRISSSSVGFGSSLGTYAAKLRARLIDSHAAPD